MGFGRGGQQGGYQGGGRGRGRGRGQGGGYGGGRGHQPHSGLAGVAIKGWQNSKIHPDQAPAQLLSWLSKNAGDCKIETHELVGQRQNVLLIWVSESDKDNLLRLNNRNWAGVKLTVENSTRPPPPNLSSGGSGFGQQITHQNGQGYQNVTRTGPRSSLFSPDVQDKVVLAIRQNYDEQNKWLNLTKFVQHELFTNLPDIVGKSPTEIWDEIFTLCKMKIWPDNHLRNVNVPSITLRENSISSVGEIRTLARIFPRIRNLDLGGNLLQDLAALGGFQTEFRQLEHIILDGNPVNNGTDLLPTLRQWYPRLKNFNNGPADGSVPVVQNVVAAPGTAIGQAPFRFDPNLAAVQVPVIPVAPNREPHPEIPPDSLFAVETVDKPAELLRAEQMGLRVSLATRLNMASTEELLKANGWDEAKAMQDFQRVNALGKLTPDKFI